MAEQSEHGDRDEVVVGSSLEQLDQLMLAQQTFKDFIRRRVPTEDIADDLLQHSLIKAVEQVHTVRNEESLVPWFYRLLRHTIIDYYRSHATEQKKHERFLKELTISEADKEPSFAEIPPEVCACLTRLLPGLRPAYAEVLRRVDLQGESIQAVAQDLNIATNNLTVRLHRARQAMRTSLEAACGVCSKHGCLNCTCD
jgi:RNA polymerase sigma-70 factor (ECF subfamily)